MKKFRVFIISLGLITVAMVQTGCFGSFKLTQSVYQWNSSIEDKTVRSMVFFALCAIPVYEAAVVIDWAVLNVVEYWDGSNPLSMKPGEKEVKVVMVKGRPLRMEVSLNSIRVFGQKKGREVLLSAFEYQPSKHTWYALKDSKRIALSRVTADENGMTVMEYYCRNGKMVRKQFPGAPLSFVSYIACENHQSIAEK